MEVRHWRGAVPGELEDPPHDHGFGLVDPCVARQKSPEAAMIGGDASNDTADCAS